ncbi:MAG: hypothetical protein EBX40_04140 [Gammaproteobacteria bacterium]|nr:hypothetical protein [Gammaproteobacteria bacterium]
MRSTILSRDGGAFSVNVKRIELFAIIFPLTLVAFICNGSMLNVFALAPIRFGLLGTLFLYLLLSGRLLTNVNPGMLFALLCYGVWSVLTLFWSTVPLLSFVKVFLSILVIATLFSGGQEWVRRYGWAQSFKSFGLVFVISLLSCMSLGQASMDYGYANRTVVLYQGLTHNPNELGLFSAIALGLLLWKLYMDWPIRKKRWIWSVFSVIFLVCLALSFSRSAILMFCVEAVVFFLCVGVKKQIRITLVSILTVLMLLGLFGDELTKFIQTHVYKSTTQVSLLLSRENAWADSFQGAEMGGLMGLGYGISFGYDEFKFDGLKSLNYGREKGNSQLAIIEETGWIGLCFYGFLLFVIFGNLLRKLAVLSLPQRILMGAIIGMLLGVLAQSVFEGWWDAADAEEFSFFWAMTGIAFGMLNVRPEE